MSNKKTVKELEFLVKLRKTNTGLYYYIKKQFTLNLV